MRLTTAGIIAQKATTLLALGRSAIRLSDVGATSVRTTVEAMLLDMADFYQVQISTGQQTVSGFERFAKLSDKTCASLVTGKVLPDEVYDRVVKENPDPERLFYALISAGYENARDPDVLDVELPTSFYKFLTSLDPVSPSYWPQVYGRLSLPFDSDTVPPDRINFDPESVRQPASNACAIATNAVESPKRGILASIFGRSLYRLSLSQDGQIALFAFAHNTHREMGDLVASGRTTSLPWAGREYFQQRLQFIRLIRERFQRFSWIELNDYDFSLLAAMIANYVIHHQYRTMPRDAGEVDLLEQVLKEMIAVGPKTGRWSVQRAIDGARQQLEQQLSLLGTPQTPAPES